MTVAGLVANLLEPDGIPQRGQGVEGLFTDKLIDRPKDLDRRVAIEKVDDRRWSFRVLPSSATALEKRKPVMMVNTAIDPIPRPSTPPSDPGMSSPVSPLSARSGDVFVSGQGSPRPQGTDSSVRQAR